MPNIKTYDAPALALQPTEVGIDATVQQARRIGAFSSQVAQAKEKVTDQAGRMFASSIEDAGKAVVDYEDHREISHGAATLAKMNDNLNNVWQDTATHADPNNPSVLGKFQEEVLEPALEDFKSGFNTEKSRQWAEQRVEAMRNEYFTKTRADMGTLAQLAVQKNIHETVAGFSNTAVNDPTSVQHSLDAIDSSIGAMVDSSPYLKGVTGQTAKVQLAEKAKEEIVKSGAFGAIQKARDPEAEAQNWITKYPQYIKGEEALQLAKAAKTQIKFNDAQDRAAVAQQKVKETQESDAAGAQLVGSMINPDGTLRQAGPADFQELHKQAQMPGAKRANIEATFNFLQKSTKNATSNEELKGALIEGLYTGTTTPLDLIKAHNRPDGLNDKDFAMLERQRRALQVTPLNDRGFTTAMTAAKSEMVIPSYHNDFAQAFIPMYLAAQKTNTLQPNDLNIHDPNSLIAKTMAAHMPPDSEKQKYMALRSLGMGTTPVVAPDGSSVTPPAAPNAPVRGLQPQRPAGVPNDAYFDNGNWYRGQGAGRMRFNPRAE